jgi:predicted RND superfamily exporter protein
MRLAFHTSSRSILVSAFILTAAGLILGLLSSVGAVKEIGNLLGRGAALSGFLVLFFLAPLLVLFDRFIIKQPQSASSKGGVTL